MAHLFIDDVYDSFNRQSLKISKIYYFPDFSFFMSQDDTHYQNYQNAPAYRYLVCAYQLIEYQMYKDWSLAEFDTLGKSTSSSLAIGRQPFLPLKSLSTD